MTMQNDEMTKLSIIVVPICWLIGAIVAVIFYFTIGKVWMKSYVLGLVTALLNFGIQISFGHRFIREVNKKENGAPIRNTVLGYIVRLLVAGVIFAFIVYEQELGSSRFKVIPALIGYGSEKVVLITVSLILNLNNKGKVST